MDHGLTVYVPAQARVCRRSRGRDRKLPETQDAS
jgi:hypothetical protein